MNNEHPMRGELIALERELRADVARVWPMWTTKAGLERWWGPDGFRSEVTRIEVRVGGGFEIAMTAVEPEIIAYLKSTGVAVTTHDRGDYDDVQVHRRLAWHGAVDFVPGVDPYTNETTVDMWPLDGGGTRVVVNITSMHDAHWTKMKTMGWDGQLDKLVALVARRPGAPDGAS